IKPPPKGKSCFGCGTNLLTLDERGYCTSCRQTFKRGKLPSKLAARAHGLNCLGKPYGENYDPKYRMKYRTPRLSSKSKNGIGHGIDAKTWDKLVKDAAAAWKKHKGPTPLVVKLETPIPEWAVAMGFVQELDQ